MTADIPAVLVADDQRDVRDALRLLLKSGGYEVHCVESPAAALEAASAGRFAAALIDLNYTRDTTSGEEGLALLAASGPQMRQSGYGGHRRGRLRVGDVWPRARRLHRREDGSLRSVRAGRWRHTVPR